MNKYQDYLMSINQCYFAFSIKGNLSKDSVLSDNKIILTQNEDITISDYILYIANDSIENVFAIKDTTESAFEKELDPVYSSPESDNQERFFIKINFEEQFDQVRIVFKNNLADDLFLPISYVVADKEKYYAKKEQERKDNLLQTASIKVSTGADLVNIYFQPCCDKYGYTEIQLFIPEKQINRGWSIKDIEVTAWAMITKCKVNTEDFYKSINGLAYGKYSFILKQYDKNANLLLETGHIEFCIFAPR